MISGRVFLCVDIGTSSLKAAYIDEAGRELAFTRQPYPASPAAGILGRHWEEALAAAAAALAGQDSRAKPDSVCISGNGPTLVPVADDGEALAPLHWYNRRQSDGQDQPHDRRACLNEPDSPPAPSAWQTALRDTPPSLFLPYVADFRKEETEKYETVRCFFSCQEWLSYRLGAEAVTVLPSPAYVEYYWDEAQCGLFGLDPARFPPAAVMGSVIGKVSSRAGADYGIQAGIPIIAAGPDFIMSLIGSGAIKPGLVCDRAGSSEGINYCSQRPVKSTELRVLPHIKEGLWNIGAILPKSGGIFELYRNVSDQKEISYDRLLEELIPSSMEFAQYAACKKGEDDIIGQILNGIQPGIDISGDPTAKIRAGRAIIGSIAFMVIGALETMANNGLAIREMRLSGGQAKNSRWNQLKADLTGLTLHTLRIPDGELAGNACISTAALGGAAGLDQAVESIVRLEKSYVPDGRVYELGRKLYTALKGRLD